MMPIAGVIDNFVKTTNGDFDPRFVLRKVGEKKERMTREEMMKAIENSPIRFTESRDKLKKDIRDE